MNNGGYLPSREAARIISTTFTDTEVNNCFSIYRTSWITSGPKSNFICENVPTKAILFFFGCSEVNSTWPITSELAYQRARKVLFTCVVYTNWWYSISPLQDPVTRCGINYTGTQMTQWDFQNKRTLTSPAWLSFVLKVPLHYLHLNIFTPCQVTGLCKG